MRPTVFNTHTCILFQSSPKQLQLRTAEGNPDRLAGTLQLYFPVFSVWTDVSLTSYTSRRQTAPISAGTLLPLVLVPDNKLQTSVQNAEQVDDS